MGFLKSLLDLILAVFRWKTSAKQQAKQEEAELEAEITKVAEAIDKGDEDTVNAQLKKMSQAVVVGFLLSALLFSGCALMSARPAKVVYVPSDQKARFVPAGKTVMAEVDSWLLPKGTFQLLMENAQRNDAKKGKAK